MKKFDFMSSFIILCICSVGLFHEYLACFAGLILSIYLATCMHKNNGIKLHFNMCLLSVTLIVISYGVTTFWALDKGAALIGFFKFLPLLLFLISVMQKSKEADDYLSLLPYIATVMTVASAVWMQIPVFEKWFSVSGRLSGFFQYSNTFAIFLLASLIILVTKEKLEKYDILMILVILFGIFYSGSRTVFVLMIVSVIGIVLFNRNKKIKTALLCVTIVVVAIAVIYAMVTDNFSTIGRFLTLSLKESTFVGRLLYFKDALPVILRHPFGMGYLGYYYYHHSIQTGVYTIRFIHNDFLQLLLDIGWIPVIVFVVTIFKAFFKRGGSLRKRLLILVMTAHTCFDFNFQYIAIFMIFVMLLDYKDGKEKCVNGNKIANVMFASILSLLFFYFGFVQVLTYGEQYELSNKIYPYNTQNHIAILSENKNLYEIDDVADTIINNNGYLAIAYDVKANIAYSKGDFAQVIKYKKQSIDVSPFTYQAYEDYCYMLINGIYLYEKNGDKYSADICKKELLSIVDRLDNNKEKLSELGKMIHDQPKTELPDDIISYVEVIANER